MAVFEGDFLERVREAASVHPVAQYAKDALTVTPAGAVARDHLAELGIETASPLPGDHQKPGWPSEPVSALVASDIDQLGGVGFPVRWSPNVVYRIRSAPGGATIELDAWSSPRIRSRFSVEHLRLDAPDQVLERCWNELSEALETVIKAIPGRANFLRHVAEVQALRRSSREQQESYEEQARHVLNQIRETLLAWSAIALRSTPPGPVPPMDKYVPVFASEPDVHFPASVPSQDSLRTEGEVASHREFQRAQRRGLAESYSPFGLFLWDLRHLWNLIAERRLKAHRMAVMAEDFDVPETVTQAAVRRLEALYEKLKAVDEHALPSAALEAACRIVEAYIVERREIPSFGDVIAQIPLTAGQIRDTRVMLEAVEGTDIRGYATYNDVSSRVELRMAELGMSEKEIDVKSGTSIVKQAKRCAHRLGQAFSSPRELIEKLRQAEEDGELRF